MAVFGDTLRQARAYKGVTLKEAEQATRINRHHLAALEDENFGVLPPLIYQRGIVRNYATYLDLDPGKLLPMFEEARGGDPTAELVAAVKPLDMPSHWAPNFAIIAFLVVMSAIVFAWVYSASFAPNNAPATASSLPPPTVTPVAELVLADLPSPTTAPDSPTAPREAEMAAVAPTPTVRTVPSRATRPSEPSPTPTEADPVRPIAPVPPTATALPPEPAAVPPTPEPVVLPTAEPVVAVVEDPTPIVALEGSVSVRFTAMSAIDYLSVTADGVTVFEGSLTAGASTDWIAGREIYFYTTNVASTQVTRQDTGASFVMGYDQAPGEFPLRADG